jgi:branched-chain amino acid transport system substrate-binding protein
VNTHKLKRKMWHLIAVIFMIGILALSLVSCVENELIRVGFVAQLTGDQAELGVQERNGVQIAVDKINAKGGINGRPIELIVKDDKGTPKGAKAADRELIKAGVVATIGHATSGQTEAGLTVTNPAHVVMLSPTTSSSELSGKQDYFFRIAQSTDTRAEMLAQYIYQDRKIHRIAVIYDTDNAAYSKDYVKGFTGKYQQLGGKVVAEEGFSSKAQPDFTALVAKLRASNPGGLLIVASDIDTALVAQRVRLAGWHIPLFTTALAQTETLIDVGGKAVEGMEIELSRSSSAPTPAYLAFAKRYQARYGRVPSFGAVQGYEAAEVLAEALKNTDGKAEGLPQALVNIKNFKGLNETYSLDKYGDVVRAANIGVIRDGKYVVIKSSKPTGL